MRPFSRSLTVLCLSFSIWPLWAVGDDTPPKNTGIPRAAESSPLARAHAHNDYLHERPLLDALNHGFCNVEADVFLLEGKLLVGHDRSELTAERTLETLYLDPLLLRVRENGGEVYVNGPSFTLLVDIKSDGEETYVALNKVLNGYEEMLTRVTNGIVEQGAVTVIVSGERAWQRIAADSARYVGVDGRLPDLSSDRPIHLMPLVSDRWDRISTWSGQGPMPDAERSELRRILHDAHDEGRRVRFWATPDEPSPERSAVWGELLAAGVDLIGTDDLDGLRTFLLAAKSGPVLKGPYLGMQPPGDVPELFAPGVVSSVHQEHSGAVFTPDGRELFWSTVINEGRNPRIVVVLHMKQEDGIWGQPELAPFNVAKYTHINSVSPDGNRLYFFSEEGDTSSNVWVATRKESGWGEPRILSLNRSDIAGRHINEVHEARSGNLYLSGPLESVPGGRGIVRSRFIDGLYREYESLGPEVNSPHSDRFPNHSPTVDPDERFVIFASTRPGGHSRQDLYISYRQPDDSWGPAINLGPEINSLGAGASWPQLSPDGKYLFFVSSIEPYRDFGERLYSYKELSTIQESVQNGWSNIYWVDTSFIDMLNPAENN